MMMMNQISSRFGRKVPNELRCRNLTNPSVAIVGSGPSGFYVAKYLKKARPDAKIDIIERWPVPYGLVRFGVAPDHPEVKSVINDFASVAEEVRFIGNVCVGNDEKEGHVSVETLRKHYDAVVLANGASGERKLNIPGEELKGVLSARKFVGWYNAEPLVEEPPLHFFDDGLEAVVIGHGNVALDCARILATPPAILSTTDISRSTLEILGRTAKVSVVGRRGPAQAAFTIKELRELMQIKDASFSVIADELDLADNEASRAEIHSKRALQRKCKLIQDAAKNVVSEKKNTLIELRFLLSPVAFEPRSDDPSRLGAIVFQRCELLGDPGAQKAHATGELIKIPASLAFTAVGYLTQALHTSSSFVPRLENDHGKIDSGLYCAGWSKRGPSGIIGTNITDARETVATMLQDFDALSSSEKCGIHSLQNATSWTDWLNLDAHERSLGEPFGAPRIKLNDVRKMLDIIRASS